MYNLDALASSTPKAAVHPPSWHPKPELFYSAYEPAPITINRATVENKIVIHDHSANSNAQVSDGLILSNSRSRSEGKRDTTEDFSDLPPPPSYFYDEESDYNGEDMNSHHLPPPPKHFTVAYLDPNTSGKCDYDDFDYADESIDPYQTLRSNGSMKSVKIAQEVTEFHYTTQESPPAVNSFGNDFHMSDHRQQQQPQEENPYQLTNVPNPVYPSPDLVNGKKSSVQSWLAKMAGGSTQAQTNDHPEVFGSSTAMGHNGDVQL